MLKAAIIGLGTMGPGIAATLVRAGMTVGAFDADANQRRKARPAIEAAADTLRALETPAHEGGEFAGVSDTLERAVADADLVVETVPERLELKREVFRQIEAVVAPRCILASDTSGIPITRIQSELRHPDRMVGMHWSNPPHLIPVIEVIAGAQTAAETVTRLASMIENFGYLPILVRKDVPGFVENRVLYALLRECLALVEEGVIDPRGLDRCVSWGIGLKLAVIGPMALLDMAGLDTYQAVSAYLNRELSAREDVPEFVTRLTAAGRLGLKTRSGIFDYAAEQVELLQRQRARKLIALLKALREAPGREELENEP